jgi:hypothetical protein
MTRCAACLVLLALVAAGPRVSAQRGGDYLTEKEIEAARAAQESDKRAEVFITIGDRRLLALTDANATPSEKELKAYGPLPTGSAIDLLDDYRRAIDELMEKIDDAYQRKGRTPQLTKGMKLASEGVDRQLKTLASLRTQLKDPEVLHYLDRAVASAKLLEEGARGAMAESEK